MKRKSKPGLPFREKGPQAGSALGKEWLKYRLGVAGLKFKYARPGNDRYMLLRAGFTLPGIRVEPREINPVPG